MSGSEAPDDPTGNRLLAALPREDYERLLPDLEPVTFGIKEVVYEPNGPILYVYFPISGVFSMVTMMADGAAVENATVGNEGMVGLPVFLGAETMPSRAFSQVPGQAVRLEAEVFREAVRRSSPFQRVLLRYTQALLNLIAQTAACNRLHSIEERCSRWLLMTHDRVGGDQFLLTQEFLGQMLGVRRQSVNAVAGILQKAALIRYRRGQITILDRQGLEAGACECYGIIRKEFDRLLG
jgi:CRP-like cAMP-binding protein